jgi:hypothetical protein
VCNGTSGYKVTRCFGPSGPSSDNMYVKITKKRYCIISTMWFKYDRDKQTVTCLHTNSPGHI